MRTREEKIQLIKDLASGKSFPNELKPVIFLEFAQVDGEEGTYVDSAGNRLSEVQMQRQLLEASKKASLVMHTIRTYENEQELVKRWKVIPGNDVLLILPDNGRERIS